MKFHYLTALGLGLFISISCQTQAAALQKSAKPLQNTEIAKKQLSPLEKAVTQQKRERTENKLVSDNDQIKIMTSINNAPSQHFLASQHQQFSRFLQSLFPQQSS
jgi:hypothetical protein